MVNLRQSALLKEPPKGAAPQDPPPAGRAVPASAARAPVAFLLVLTISALVLRLYRLGAQSFWLDEVAIYTLSSGNLGDVVRAVADKNYPEAPLHPLLLHLWLGFGSGEMWARLLSVVATVPFVWLTYALGRAWAGDAAGRWAAVFAALSPFHVWYSQDVRMYALYMTLMVAATLALWWAVREGQSMRQARIRWGVYVLASAGSLLSHVYAALGLVAHGVWVLTARRRALRSFILAQLAIAALVLPWVIAVARSLITSGAPEHLARETPLAAIPYTFFTWSAGFSLGPSVAEIQQHLSLDVARGDALSIAVAALAFCTAFVLGARTLWWSRTPELRAGFLCAAALIVVPVLLAFLVARHTAITYNVRHVSFVLPAYLVIVGAGVASCPLALRAALAGLLLVVTVASLGNHFFNPRYAKADMRAAAAAAEREGAPAVVVGDASAFTFYADGHGPALVLDRESLIGPGLEQVTTLLRKAGAVSLVRHRWWDADPSNLVYRTVSTQAQLEREAVLPGVILSRFRALPAS